MKSRVIQICLSLTFLALAPLQAVALGCIVGNSGNGILCRPSPDNDLNGFYSLDYVLTRTAARGDNGDAPVATWQASMSRILSLLQTKVPSLAGSFGEFSSLIYNKSYLYPRVWEPSAFGLQPLNDQQIASLIPANCLAADGSIQVSQIVTHQYESFSGTARGNFIYKFDPALIGKLEAQSALQLSYLFVHEWLWDISMNIDRNRRINRFLHSREIETMSPQQVQETLRGMGLGLPELPSDAFTSSQWQGKPMTEKEFFAHYDESLPKKSFGQIQIESRERETCPDEFCDPNWKKSIIPRVLFEQNRFFLVPAWTGGDPKFPVRILSPDLLSRVGTAAIPANAQIFCRFQDDGEFNLECEVRDGRLLYPLFVMSSETPAANWPRFKATMTEDYFRAVIPSSYSMDVVGPNGRSHDTRMFVETAITTRFKLRPVSTEPTIVPKTTCEQKLVKP